MSSLGALQNPGASKRIPENPWMDSVAAPGVSFFQSTLGGNLQKGTLSGDSNVDLYSAEAKLPYAAINYFSNPGSSSEFLPNPSCKCPGNAVNPDNVCVGGRTESLPWAKKSQFQAQMMNNLLQHGPYMSISKTEAATMIRAAPLPMGTS